MIAPYPPALRAALAQVAPGRALREGIDRILQAGMGGLVIVGDGPEVLNICSGGFLLDAAFSPQRLSELAKMDGAIILASDASRIARANVHLVPDSSVATSETGTRHRTAERVARSLGVPVITVSQRMSTIKIYVGDEKHEVVSTARVINRANQALSTLERYRSRLETDAAALSTLEIEDLVTIRDVVNVLQLIEGVERIASEVQGHIIELGDEGRLVRLQLVELMGGVESDRRHLVRDYRGQEKKVPLDSVLESLGALSTEDLIDPAELVHALRLPTMALDAAVSPRGYRMLSRIPRLPDQIVERIVGRFGSLQKIMRATIDDLDDVEGVGATRAKAIKEGLTRIAESSILDRYRASGPTTSGSPTRPRSDAARSAGAALELFAVGDAVAAVVLFDPAQAHEAGDGLVDPLPRRPDHARQLLLGDRQREVVGVARQLQQPLGRAPGDVEEHRVGQGGVGVAQPLGQQLHPAPQQVGSSLVDAAQRLVGHLDELGRLQRPGLRRPAQPVEEPHLAEHVAVLHQGHHGLPAVDRPLGDGDPPRRHHAQPVRFAVLGEHDVAPQVPAGLGRRRDGDHLLVGQVSQELDVLEQVDVHHGRKATHWRRWPRVMAHGSIP